jgi:hypothetical protein
MSRRCFGVTHSFHRCARIGDWRFFCSDHRFQPVGWACFALTIVAGIAGIQSAWFQRHIATPRVIQAQDFRLRFAITGADLSKEDLKRAPPILPCNGKIGAASVKFELHLIPTLEYESSHSRPMPNLVYEANNFLFRNFDLLNKQGLEGQTLKFSIPWEIHDFAGPSTQFNADLYVGDAWYPTGYKSFGDGNVIIRLDQPTR